MTVKCVFTKMDCIVVKKYVKVILTRAKRASIEQRSSLFFETKQSNGFPEKIVCVDFEDTTN
jgi:hypothetical protein